MQPKWLSLSDVIHPNVIWEGIEEPNTSRYQGKIIDKVTAYNDIISIDVVFDSKPWSYQWIANRWHETDHAFVVSVLVPPVHDSSTRLLVTSQFTSPTFRIGCTRRVACGHAGPYESKESTKQSVKGCKGNRKKNRKAHSKGSYKAHSQGPFHGYNHRNVNKMQPKIPVQQQPIINQNYEIDSDSEEEVEVKRRPKKNQPPVEIVNFPPEERYEEMFSTKEVLGTSESAASMTDTAADLLTSDSAAIMTDAAADLLTSDSAAVMTFDCAAVLSSEFATSLELDEVRMRMMSAVEQLYQEPSPSEIPKTGLDSLYESATLVLSCPGTLSFISPNGSCKRSYDDDFAEESSPHSPRTPRYVSV